MAIPYRTAKFKSANIRAIEILGSTAKFNSRQYFRLYRSRLASLRIALALAMPWRVRMRTADYSHMTSPWQHVMSMRIISQNGVSDTPNR